MNTAGERQWLVIVALTATVVVGWVLGFAAKAANAAELEGSSHRTWTVTDFTGISVAGSPSVRIVPGEQPGVSASGNDESLRELTVGVRDGVLHIRPGESPWFKRTGKLNVVVRYRAIDELKVAGSADVTTSEPIELSDDLLRLSVTGSGDVHLPFVKAKSLSALIRGSGELKLGGEVDQQSIAVTGSGSYQAPGLISARADVAVAGSGNAYLYVSDTLNARVTGSGEVRHRGSAHVTQSIAGSGTVAAVNGD